MVFGLIYLVMFFITLISLHVLKDRLDINDYDGPNKEWEEWDSNAQAYAAWSLGWPIVWIAVIAVLIWKGVVFISKKIGELIK